MHFQLTAAIALSLSWSCCGFAQDGSPGDDPLPSERSAVEQKLLAEQGKEIERLARQLGSNQFAQRERATTALLRVGMPAIAVLKRIEQTAQDPEVGDRVSALSKQISESNTQSKIDRFMAGQRVGFGGWDRFREVMGNSVAVRELFVDIHREHPALLESLDRDFNALQLAMETVNAKVQHRMFVMRQHPSQADTVALLLPALNGKVTFHAGYETTIVGVLDRIAAQQIRRDSRLEPGFRSLLGAWVKRCTLTNRIETLAKAMQWEIPEALPIAISTLSETDEMQALVVSMQTIARFGKKKDASALKSLLSDDRVTGEAGYGKHQLIQSQVRDVAIATIAILHDVPLTEVGFPQASTHAIFGFTILGIGFADHQAETREKSLQRVEALISPPATNGS